jgi:hypothetical protein
MSGQHFATHLRGFFMISDEELGYALKLLSSKFKGPDDLIHFWKIAGKSVYPGPRIEQCRPWFKDLGVL